MHHILDSINYQEDTMQARKTLSILLAVAMLLPACSTSSMPDPTTGMTNTPTQEMMGIATPETMMNRPLRQ
jgi:hypothetical protein